MLSMLSNKWENPIMEKDVQGHNSNVLSLCFNRAGSQMATSSKNGEVKVWNLKPRLNSYVFADDAAPVHCVRFSPCDRLLASTSRAYVRIRTPRRESDFWVFKAHVSTVRGVDFSHDSKNFATCGDDKSVKIWDIIKFSERFAFSLIGHKNWVRCVRFSPDSNNVVSCSDDSTVKIWDLRSKNCQATFCDSLGCVKSAQYHPSGHFVASAAQDKTVRLWDLRTGRVIQQHALIVGSVNELKFDSTGKYLGCACSDGTVKLYDTIEGRIVYTLHGHQGQVHCVDFTMQNDYLCSGDSVGKILFWKTNFARTNQQDATPKEIVVPVKQQKSPEAAGSSPRRSGRCGSVDGTGYSPPRKLLNGRCDFCRHRPSSPTVSNEILLGSDKLLAAKIEKSMQEMLAQMALLVDTMNLMEKRLSRTEHKVENIFKNRSPRRPHFR